MQRYPICWSGDPNCTWQDMANTLRAGLSIGLSGVPFWSCDNAGFRNRPGWLTPELWIRWSQMSAFLSHWRLNGIEPPARVPWSFGEMATRNFSKYGKLRSSLLPYTYSHAYDATKTGLPVIRAMVLEYPDDICTYGIDDQYMFGDAFLVAPVCTMENKRSVYLPKGIWYEHETGEKIVGPATLHIEPPLEQLPLYVRDDTIIPMTPPTPYASDKAFSQVILDIRLSSQAQFTLYDDDVETGAREIVNMRADKRLGQSVLELGASHKTYIAKFNNTKAPASVSLNGADVPRLESLQALQEAKQGWYADPSRIVHVKFDARGRKNRLTLA
jgi:alpha-D-xyloside xylohydrolase